MAIKVQGKFNDKSSDQQREMPVPSELIKSSLDKNDYKFKTLPNGLQLVLVSNPELKMCSCALSVPVGFHDDFQDFPGISHFLEHMLVLGDGVYTTDNSFVEFFSTRGGHRNAYTTNETTYFYCTTQSIHLKSMSNIFGNFFIKPLFKKESVEKELSAVNSEFLNCINDSTHRFIALTKELMKKGTNESKFSIGNRESLQYDDIHIKVEEFWNENYSANEMVAVLVGRETLNELEEIGQIYGKIPTRTTGRFSKESQCNRGDSTVVYEKQIFDEEFYQKLIRLKPLDNDRSLKILITLPTTYIHYKQSPLTYIANVFAKTDEDSLYYKLKEKNLALGLSFYPQEEKKFTIITIYINLTTQGEKKYKEVLGLIMNSLDLLLISEGEYHRFSEIFSNKFNLSPSPSVESLAASVAFNMQWVPKEYIFRRSDFFGEFDQPLITSLLSYIKDYRKWIVVLTSKEGDFDKSDKYFGIQYAIDEKIDFDSLVVEKIEHSFKEKVEETPHPKSEIISLSELIDLPGFKSSSQGYLYKTEELENGTLFFQFDDSFKSPTVNIQIVIKSNEVYESLAALSVWIQMVIDSFSSKYSSELQDALASICMISSYEGIFITAGGLNSRIVDILILLFNEFHLHKTSTFEAFVDLMKNNLQSEIAGSPYNRLASILAQENTIYGLKDEKYLKNLDDIHIEDIKFVKNYLTDIIAVGNIHYSEVKRLFEEFSCKTYNPEPVISINNFSKREIPFKTFDGSNNAICIGYKCKDSQKDYAISLLHTQICSGSFFQELRTVEELGYIVGAQNSILNHKGWLLFIVQSTQPTEHLKARILKFVDDLKTRLTKLTPEEFNVFRQTILEIYKNPHQSISSLFVSAVTLYNLTGVDFEYSQKMIDVLEKIELKDLVESDFLSDEFIVYSYLK